MTGAAHLNWLPDVFSASKWERDVATALAAYSAEPTVSTVRDLARALNNLSGMLYGWRNRWRSLAAMQSAVAVLRHEVDALHAGSDATREHANDLIYLLDGLAGMRLDAGLPEAATRNAPYAPTAFLRSFMSATRCSGSVGLGSNSGRAWR